MKRIFYFRLIACFLLCIACIITSMEKPQTKERLEPSHYLLRQRDKNLFMAAALGNVAELQSALEHGANMHAVNHQGKTALHQAIISEHDAVVEILLKRGANVNAKDREDNTPLHLAVLNEHMALILLEAGADVNAQDTLGITALHMAALGGNLVVVQLLIERGASANTRDANGNTPLHFAIHNGNTNIVQFLLDRGADAFIKNNYGKSAFAQAEQEHYADHAINALLRTQLQRATSVQSTLRSIPCSAIPRPNVFEIARIGTLEDMQQALERGADPNSADAEGNKLLLTTVQRLDYGMAKMIAELLISQGAETDGMQDKEKNTLLHMAVRRGNLTLVKLLTERGAEINARNEHGNTPLHETTVLGSTAIAQYLLERGANHRVKNNKGETACGRARSRNGLNAPLALFLSTYELRATRLRDDNPVSSLLLQNVSQLPQPSIFDMVRRGAVDLLQEALERGIDPNSQDGEGNRIILRAAEYFEDATAKMMVELLINKGAIINDRPHRNTPYRNTPLHVAAYHRNTAVVQLLLEHGALVNAQDEFGITPLYNAAFRGHVATVQALIERGANVNRQNSMGFGPLHTASVNGNLEVVQLLVKNAAEVNLLQNDIGITPLHYAVDGGNIAIVRFLIEAEAQVNLKDKLGRAPLHWTVRHGRTAIAELLIERGANVALENDEGMTAFALALQEHGPNHPLTILLATNTRQATPVPVQNMATLAPNSSIPIQPDIFQMARQGSVDAMRQALEQGVDPNSHNEHGQTPLLLAAGYFDDATAVMMVTLLLERGAQVETRSTLGGSPLHQAARSGNTAVIELLLKRGAQVNAIVGEGLFTALMAAAYDDKVTVVQQLIEGGAKIDAGTDEGWTALHFAVSARRRAVVELLIKGGAQINLQNNDGVTPLHMAERYGASHPITELLRIHGQQITTLPAQNVFASSNQSNQTQLDIFTIARTGTLQEMKQVLATRINVNSENNEGARSLWLAAVRQNQEIGQAMIELLIERGAFPNPQWQNRGTLLSFLRERFPMRANMIEMIERATRRVVDPLLIRAINEGNVENLRSALLGDANPNAADDRGYSAIWLAAHHGNSERAVVMVQALLARGAVPTAQHPVTSQSLIDSLRVTKGRSKIVTILSEALQRVGNLVMPPRQQIAAAGKSVWQLRNFFDT